MIKNNNNNAVIQIGDKTHIQDQVIYPVNFNPMNNIVSNPTKPNPPLF
jgi:hypothetical protein